jgi:hypothetical protein
LVSGADIVYQHSEDEILRKALNARHIPQHTTENDNSAVD